ncbi:hypothetical protein UPYG_G00188760 [Umbra pygmaea]|uniref:Uncharacterized protein n=1 Tax=Umbra pygmaea TaxID=75934 RepID=A0ABD0X915_UMBPY
MLVAPLQSSSPLDKVNGQASDKPLANKRIRKPTEKALAYKDSVDGKSPKPKKCRKKSPPKVPLVSQPFNLVQPTLPCTFILTPSGLMPISGTGFQMTHQSLPVASTIFINQQVPLSLNAVPYAFNPCSTTIISSTAPRMTIPVDNLHVTKPVMQSVATSGPQLSAESPVALKGPERVISTPLLPHSGPLQTLVLTVPPDSQSAFSPQRALDVALPNSPNPAIQSVATSGPQLIAVSPVALKGPERVISTPLLPHSGPLQTSVLTVPPDSQSAFSPQRALDVALPNSPNPAIQSGKPRKMSFDPKLMFKEVPGEVGMWFRGKNGVTLPELDVTLPYLPPFVSNLTTLSALLKHKPMLAANAKLVLTPEEKNQSEEDQIAAVRSHVAERFSHNPGYLLLKARFLSCFTMPAFLATIDTVQRLELSSEDYSGEEELLSNCPLPEGDTGCEELPALQAPLLSTDGTGAPATSFSGMITRNRSLYINKESH